MDRTHFATPNLNGNNDDSIMVIGEDMVVANNKEIILKINEEREGDILQKMIVALIQGIGIKENTMESNQLMISVMLTENIQEK